MDILESYAAERADFQRLLDAIDHVRGASVESLRRLEWVEQYVGMPGLSPLHPAEKIYPGHEDLMNGSHQGITQYPREFARWLLLLADHAPRTYLEIGCFNGHTACLAAAYLQRFNPELRVVTIDIHPWFLFEPEASAILPLEYQVGKTSFAFRGEKFDAVFIDGDHTFEWALADYRNVGRAARVCGMHDICGAYFLENHDLGGVVAAWQAIRRDETGEGIEFLEFSDHPAHDYFGIGVRIRHSL